MVRSLVLSLGLLGTLNAWAMNAQIDRKTIALGEPLTLSLAGKSESLEVMDLAPLRRDFEIHSHSMSRDGSRASMQITLYPLRLGKLDIPALSGGGERSKQLAVQVTDGSDLMPAIRLKVFSEPAQPLARQASRLSLEICDDGSLEWKRPLPPLNSGAQLRTLGEEQIDIEIDGTRCTAHRYHWALLPTRSGELRIDLPMLEAGKFGRRLRLPPPPALVDVRAVPAWLPLNVAVGKPNIAAEPLPEEWPSARPLAWRFTVEGGYSIDGLKALLKLQLQPHEIWKAYPPTVEALATEDRNSPLTRLAVTLYALPDATGPLTVPALALPYFDPATSRMENLALPRRDVDIYSPTWRKAKHVAWVLLGYVLLHLSGEIIRRELRWRRTRRQTLLAIADTTSFMQLEHILRAFSFLPDTPAASLGLWLVRMTDQSHKTDSLPELVATLESCCYGLDDRPLADLQQKAISVIARMRPRLKLLLPQE